MPSNIYFLSPQLYCFLILSIDTFIRHDHKNRMIAAKVGQMLLLPLSIMLMILAATNPVAKPMIIDLSIDIAAKVFMASSAFASSLELSSFSSVIFIQIVLSQDPLASAFDLG